MRYGVILAVLLIPVCLGWLISQAGELDSDSRTVAAIARLSDERVATIAGDSSDAKSSTSLDADIEQSEEFHELVNKPSNLFSGPFGYVNVFLATMTAAGVAYILKARAAGASGA